MPDRDERDLLSGFEGAVAKSIDAEGMRWPHASYVDGEGQLTLAVLAMVAPTPQRLMDEIFNAVHAIIEGDRPVELILGIDNFALPGQGNEFTDFIAVYHWKTRTPWRYGVMDYHVELEGGTVAWDAYKQALASWEQAFVDLESEQAQAARPSPPAVKEKIVRPVNWTHPFWAEVLHNTHKSVAARIRPLTLVGRTKSGAIDLFGLEGLRTPKEKR